MRADVGRLHVITDATLQARFTHIELGSVTVARVPAILETGAHGVAVLSAVVCHPDPAVATSEFRRAIDAGLLGRDEIRARPSGWLSSA